MSNVVAPGKYIARIKNYGVRTVKSGEFAGKAAPTIQFQIRDANTAQMTDSVFWQGTFRDGKGRKIAMEALFTCGMTSELFERLPDGPLGGALDMNRDIEIDVINENATQPDGSTKTYAKVAWINFPGGAAFMNMMNRAEFAVQMAQMGLLVEFLEIEKARGVVHEKKQSEELLKNIPF